MTGLQTRDEFLRAHTSTTRADVAFALELAETPVEVDQAAHLSLVLFDVSGCQQPFVERDRSWMSLHQLVIAARTRVHGYPEISAELRTHIANTAEQARRAQIRQRNEITVERERRIAAAGGFNNAKPIRPNRRSNP